MPVGKIKIQDREFSFLVNINYTDEEIIVTTQMRTKNLSDEQLVYTFNNLGVEYKPESNKFNAANREVKEIELYAPYDSWF